MDTYKIDYLAHKEFEVEMLKVMLHWLLLF